jgi:hypothetical protein
MPDLRIGNAKVSVEGIRQLKADTVLDDKTKSSLMKDGFDEIIFKKGDSLYIAYQKNMDLAKLNLNLDEKTFDVNTAYDPGQLSLDGDAVQAVFVDDENKDSFWVAPYKAAGNTITSMVNNPFGKSALIGFSAGAITTLTAKIVPGAWNDGPSSKLMAGVMIGTGLGTVGAGLKAAEENNEADFWDTGAGIGAAAVGYGVGIGAGIGGYELVKAAIQNPAVTAVSLGATAVVVGTGVVIDKLSDNNKPATYRVINSISAH